MIAGWVGLTGDAGPPSQKDRGQPPKAVPRLWPWARSKSWVRSMSVVGVERETYVRAGARPISAVPPEITMVVTMPL